MTQAELESHENRLRLKLTKAVSDKLGVECCFLRWEPVKDARGRPTGASQPVFGVPESVQKLAESLGLLVEIVK